MSGPSGPSNHLPVVPGTSGVTLDDFIGVIFGQVDGLGTRVVSNFYHQLASAMGPVFAVLAALYIALFGLQLIYGEKDVSMPTLYKTLGGLVVIYVLTFSWALFEPLIAKPLMNAPNGIAIIACQVASPEVCGTGQDGTAGAIMNILRAGYSASTNISAAGGITGLGLRILGYIILCFVGLFIVTAIGMIILGKMGMFLMLALAPLFLTCGLFPRTRNIFEGWIQVVGSFFVFQIIVFGTLGFTFTLVNSFMSKVVDAGGNVSMKEIIPFIIMLIVSFTLLKASMLISLAIAGGPRMDTSAGFLNAARRTRQIAGGIAGGVAVGAGYVASLRTPAGNPSIGPDTQRATVQAAAREARR